MGPQAVLAASPYQRATSRDKKNNLNPTFAVGRHQPEAYKAAAKAVRAFRTAYRDALKQWRDGNRNAEFPAGTVVMRWLHRANVAPAPG